MRQLWSNVKTNLIYYRRNKFLVGALLLMSFVTLAFSVPSIFGSSTSNQFNVIVRIHFTSNYIIYFFVALIGLLTVSHHLKERSLKMVITRPCSLEIWLLSHFVSALSLALGLYLLGGLITSGLFLFLNVSYQWGLWFVTINMFIRTGILFSILLILSLYMRPIIAGICAGVVSEFFLFDVVKEVAARAQTTDDPTLFIQAMTKAIYGIYWMLPIYTPYRRKTETIVSSLQVNQLSDWALLGPPALYALLLTSLSFWITILILRNRNKS